MSGAMQTVTFVGDLSLIDRVGEALSALPARAVDDLSEALGDSVDRIDELFTLHDDRSAAAGANEVIVRAYPSDRFLSLVAAARARNPDLGVIEQLLLRHRRPPVEGEQHSAVPPTALPPAVPMDGAS